METTAMGDWENGYSEPFNAKLRDELLDREIFYTVRPHSALGYRPPAPAARSWSKFAMSPRSELELLTVRT